MSAPHEPSDRWHYRVRVRLVRETPGAFGLALRCAGDIADAFRSELAPLAREQFMCEYIDAKNRLISREIVRTGHVSIAERGM